MFNKFRDDPEIGFFNAYGEVSKERNPSEMMAMGHLWSYGTTKKAWEKRQDFFNKYYSIVEGKDYAYRSIPEIEALHSKVGAKKGIANSQDGAKSVAGLLCNQIKISPSVNMGKYIGEVGFHATPAFYSKRGFGRMPIYDTSAINDFVVNKEAIRRVLQEKYMEK